MNRGGCYPHVLCPTRDQAGFLFRFTSGVARPLVRNGCVYRRAQGQPGALPEVSSSSLNLALTSVVRPLVVVLVGLAAVLPKVPAIGSNVEM